MGGSVCSVPLASCSTWVVIELVISSWWGSLWLFLKFFKKLSSLSLGRRSATL